jgi:hypothetical protein
MAATVQGSGTLEAADASYASSDVLDAIAAVDERRGQRPVHRSAGASQKEAEPREARAASSSTTSR